MQVHNSCEKKIHRPLHINCTTYVFNFKLDELFELHQVVNERPESRRHQSSKEAVGDVRKTFQRRSQK
jgi:hypothetical protein